MDTVNPILGFDLVFTQHIVTSLRHGAKGGPASLYHSSAPTTHID